MGDIVRVDLIVKIYEWICPFCETLNEEKEIPQGGLIDGEVQCLRCKVTFNIGNIEHAYRQ